MIRATFFLLLLLTAPLHAAPPASNWMGVPGASAEMVREPVFNGRVMLYRAGPKGAEPVVLVHGLGQNGARDWSKLVPALAGKYEVFALDLPGFGLSDKGNHLYSPPNFARVIDAVIAPRVTQPFTLIGHSMGGAVSLQFAGSYPQRLRRLVLVDMAGVLHQSIYAEFLSAFGLQHLTGMDPGGMPGFGEAVRGILGRAETFGSASQLLLQVPAMRQRLMRGDPNTIAAFALVGTDFSSTLRSVNLPTLLIWGAQDRIAPLRTGQLAASLIPGARLAVLLEAEHVPQQQLPERFNAIVLDELEGRSQIAPFALAPGAPAGERDETCDNESGRRFSGDYRQITLSNCTGAVVSEARVGVLLATNSSVEVINSHVARGIDARNSTVKLTGGSVAGRPALSIDNTTIDAAGTRFDTDGAVVENRGLAATKMHFSVSEVRGANAGGRYVHDSLRLEPNGRW